MDRPIVVYESEEAMLVAAADEVRARAVTAVHRDGRFSLRIGEGPLPARVVDLLSAEPLRELMPWPRTRMLLPRDPSPEAGADLLVIGSGDKGDFPATDVLSLQLGPVAGRSLGELRRRPAPHVADATRLMIMTDAATAATARKTPYEPGDRGTADDELSKRNAGEAAARLVADDTVVGLGTGSTAAWFVRALGRRLREGALRKVVGVPTSEATLRLAQAEGIPTTSLADRPDIDLTVDGADEVSPRLDLIKGMGGALVREKIVALSSARMVVIADAGKLTPRLGERHAVPLAVVPFGWESHARALCSLPARIELRMAERGAPYVTDDGLYVLHVRFPDGIENPAAIEAALESRPGAAACGLFLELAESVLVGDAAGVWDYRRTPGT